VSLQDEIDAKRREIQTEGYPMSIGEVMNLYRDQELDIHPEFQRFFRWSIQQKSRFIESLLLGIPIPSIFVNQREDGVWDVVDGLQRLSTIFEFAGVLVGENGETLPASKLVATAYLPSLNGKKWESDNPEKSLTAAQRLILKRVPLDLKIIKRESDPDTQLDLFQRLNTGGSQLSDQELRNSLLIMVDRSFYVWISELNGNPDFQGSIAVSDRAIEEQYDLELVLRFMACHRTDDNDLSNIGDMSDFLSGRAVEYAHDPDFDRQAEQSLFEETFELINGALGDDAFRKFDVAKDRFSGGFSVSSFEAITAGVAHNLDAWKALGQGLSNRLRDAVIELWQDETFRTNSGSGIRASSRIARTVPHARNVIFIP
jgi:Protein of unknown function DUF262